jgi:hypothetical protein
MNQLESFITSSAQATPHKAFVEATWLKTAQAYQATAKTSLWQHFHLSSKRWLWGFPLATALSAVVMVGIFQHQQLTQRMTGQTAQTLSQWHDDSPEALDQDVAHLEKQIVNDPVIDEALSN